MQDMKLDMDDLENIWDHGKHLGPLELPYPDENGNPNLGYIALGESLSGQLLGILEQLEDLNGAAPFPGLTC